MSKSFHILKKQMSSSAQKAAKRKANKMLAAMPLFELRQARQLSQEHLAAALSTKQANISRLEHRADMYVSTLRSYVAAMGGTLEITARFPEGSISINQFCEIK